MYTTNVIKRFNRQLRKVTKNKTIFLTDFSLEKSLYLTMLGTIAKLESRMKGWEQIVGQLQIFFAEILENIVLILSKILSLDGTQTISRSRAT